MSSAGLEDRVDLRRIYDTLPVGLFVIEHGVLVYTNETLAALVGTTPEALEGKPATRLVMQDARSTFARLLGEAASRPGPSEADVPLMPVRGEPFDAALVVTRLPRTRTLVGLVRDLSEQRKMERRLIEAEKLRVFGELASGIAHDFNNLLGAIMGRAQALQRRADEGGLNRELELIERLASEGAETVRRLQQVAKSHIDSGRSPIELAVLAAECLELTRPRWFDRCLSQGISIDVRTNFDEVAPISGSMSEVREVIINLILNAVDAMPYGGTLSMRCWQEAENVFLEVHDTGQGIPKEVQARIFEPFFTTKGAKGNGLGLSVASAIMEQHRGRIQLTSQPGRGSMFVLRFPVAVNEPEAPGQPDAPPPPAENMSVLLVEDEPHIRETLQEMLQGVGVEVATASDGQEALEQLEGASFDVVITDLGLPGANGYEVAAAARRLGAARYVVLTTGWGASLEQDDWRRFGIDALLAKPFRFDDVLRTLAELREGGTRKPLDPSRNPAARDAIAKARAVGEPVKPT